MAMLLNGKFVCPLCGGELNGPWEKCHNGWYPMRLTGSYNDSPWAPAFRKDLIDFQRNTWDGAIESMKAQNKEPNNPVEVKDRQDVERIFDAAR